MNRADILAKRLLEAEPEPAPVPEQEPTETPAPAQPSAKEEINKLLPSKQYRFVGSSAWNAAGMLNLALRGFKLGIKSDQKWGLGVMRAMNAPEHVIDALINDRATILADGNDAIVTVNEFGRSEHPKHARKRQRAYAQGRLPRQRPQQ